jgi:hypothetical protein
MHFTFILLLSWVAIVHWRQEQSLTAAMAGVFSILAVFTCVVLRIYTARSVWSCCSV